MIYNKSDIPTDLQQYFVRAEIGLESTLQEFVATMVEVFDVARDLLADDGTLWVNLGDSYATGTTAGRNATSTTGSDVPAGWAGRNQSVRVGTPSGLKTKDLMGVPWRVAFALQDAGWFLRQDIIWSKPNPMPESVRDRCTKAHEYLFLLTKRERYYFDQDAILEPCSPNTHARLAQDVQAQIGSTRANGGAKTNGNMKAVARAPGNVNPPKGQAAYEAGDERHRTKAGLLAYAERCRDVGIGANARPRKAAPNGSGTKNNGSFDAAMAIMPERRNKRSVWTIATESYSEAHFATFPQALVEPCILAGSRPGDIVFDPFMGSGTVAQVAQRLGRKWLGAELNPAYIELQRKRVQQFGLELHSTEQSA